MLTHDELKLFGNLIRDDNNEKNLKIFLNSIQRYFNAPGTRPFYMKRLSDTFRASLVFDCIEVKDSQIHGRGVFDKQPIKMGDVITVYPYIVNKYYDGRIGVISDTTPPQN